MPAMMRLMQVCFLFVSGIVSHPGHERLEHRRDSLVARDFNSAHMYANWPSYADLPLDVSYPTKAAWDVWGANDSLGALNHITPSTIKAATQEIQLGQTFNLNLELHKIVNPINAARKPLTHLFQPGDGYTDDVVVLNTQISTQYDGLRHFPYSTNNSVESFRWYNDLIEDYEDVIGPNPTKVLGIHEAAQKGIVGRGVLLDFAGYAEAMGMEYDAFDSYAINVSTWDAVAAWQGLERNWSRPGDILLTRTGWLKKYNELNSTEAAALPWIGSGNSIGFEASDASLEWLWEKKLALVGADNPAFESLPFDGVVDGTPRSLHQIFIGGELSPSARCHPAKPLLTTSLGWGQSIMEFLDLEDLAAKLHALNRSTFFLTIQNLNVVSGIASPPNAMAIL